MAWQVDTYQSIYSTVYTDPALPGRRQIASSSRPRNYARTAGGVLDAECSIVNTEEAGGGNTRNEIEGLPQIIEIGEHTPSGGSRADGWLRWSGRRGANFFGYRLVDIGWLNWSDNSFVGLGAPTYDRRVRTIEESEYTKPGHNARRTAASYRWTGLWPNIRQEVNVSTRHINPVTVVTPAARAVLGALRPAGPDQYIGHVFELDDSDIPRFYNEQGQLLTQAQWRGFTVPLGESVYMRTSSDDLLGIIRAPIAHVVPATPDPALANTSAYQAAMRFKMFRSGGVTYMFAGIPRARYQDLASGPLYLDPSITNENVARDGYAVTNPSALYQDTGYVNTAYVWTNGTSLMGSFAAQFDGSALAAGETVDDADLDIDWGNQGNSGTPVDLRIEWEDVANSANYADSAGNRPQDRTWHSTNNTYSSINQGTSGAAQNYDVTTGISSLIVQEGPANIVQLAMQIRPDGTPNAYYNKALEESAYDAANLTINVSSGGASDAVPSGTLELVGVAPADRTLMRDAVDAGGLELVGFAPSTTTTSNRQTDAVPSATLDLVPFAPLTRTAIRTPVPSATLSLDGIAPSTTTTTVTSGDAVPSAILALVGYAPTTTLTVPGVISDAVPAGTLELIGYAPATTVTDVTLTEAPPAGMLQLRGFAPLTSGGTTITPAVTRQPAGGGPSRARRPIKVRLGDRFYTVWTEWEAQELLRKYLDEQRRILAREAEKPATTERKRRIRVIQNRIKRVETRVETTTQRAQEAEEEFLLMLM